MNGELFQTPINDKKGACQRREIISDPQRREIVISMGSNMGDSIGSLQQAVTWLGQTEGISLAKVSSLYCTAPVENTDQADFYNLTLIGYSTLAPIEILHRCQMIENDLGRVRDPRNPKGPRTLDIDIVKVEDFQSDIPELQLPHPRAHQRAFVLVPWYEIEPEAQLPQGMIKDLLPQLKDQYIRRISDQRIRLS